MATWPRDWTRAKALSVGLEFRACRSPQAASTLRRIRTARGMDDLPSLLQVDLLQLPVGRAFTKTAENRLQQLHPDEQTHGYHAEDNCGHQVAQADQ